MIFIDRQCPFCHGEGCAECHGTGMIGSVSGVDVPMPQPEPDSFGERMRAWRLEHGRTFRELSADTGILPSVFPGLRTASGCRQKKKEQGLRSS